METSKRQTLENEAADLVKDQLTLRTNGKNGCNNTAKDGSKVIQPRSVTALGGQYCAVVKVQR